MSIARAGQLPRSHAAEARRLPKRPCSAEGTCHKFSDRPISWLDVRKRRPRDERERLAAVFVTAQVTWRLRGPRSSMGHGGKTGLATDPKTRSRIRLRQTYQSMYAADAYCNPVAPPSRRVQSDDTQRAFLSPTARPPRVRRYGQGSNANVQMACGGEGHQGEDRGPTCRRRHADNGNAACQGAAQGEIEDARCRPHGAAAGQETGRAGQRAALGIQAQTLSRSRPSAGVLPARSCARSETYEKP